MQKISSFTSILFLLFIATLLSKEEKKPEEKKPDDKDKKAEPLKKPEDLQKVQQQYQVFFSNIIGTDIIFVDLKKKVVVDKLGEGIDVFIRAPNKLGQQFVTVQGAAPQKGAAPKKPGEDGQGDNEAEDGGDKGAEDGGDDYEDLDEGENPSGTPGCGTSEPEIAR